jgi:hypothetical protein
MDDKNGPQTISDVLQTADIALDSYDDIFSDFDPSPYSRRILSADFLKELHRRYSETKKGDIAVKFTLPRALRSERKEGLVKKRIKDYFKERLKGIEKKTKEKFQKGIFRLLMGVAISVAVFIFPELDTVPLVTLLSVLIWFELWSAYDNLFDVPVKLRREKAFYEKFIKADYSFLSEEDVVESLQKLQEQPAAAPEPPKAQPQQKAAVQKGAEQAQAKGQPAVQKPAPQKAAEAPQPKAEPKPPQPAKK